jgi:hypothetical protein
MGAARRLTDHPVLSGDTAMAADDDSARPARARFFPGASDDELVDVEAYIQARVAAAIADAPDGSDTGMRRELEAEKMRVDVENAVRADVLCLRDKLGDKLPMLPPRRQLEPFAGVRARMADLAVYAFDQWDVRKEPQADEQRTAPEPASDTPAPASEVAPGDSQQIAASNAAPESADAGEQPEPAIAVGMVVANRQKRNRSLAADIDEAQKRAPDPVDPNSVYGELQKMAAQGFGLLLGHSSDGIQYRGKKHEDTGVADVLTKKMLADRMYRKKKRAETR